MGLLEGRWMVLSVICQYCRFDMTMASEYERVRHEGVHLQERLKRDYEQNEKMFGPYDERQMRFSMYRTMQERLAKQIAARLEAALERQRQ
jgi:hypothetical protein